MRSDKVDGGRYGQFDHGSGLYKVILWIKPFSFDRYASFINVLKMFILEDANNPSD